MSLLMKKQNNVFGKYQGYYTTMSGQEKRQRAESFLAKKNPQSSNYAPPTQVQYI